MCVLCVCPVCVCVLCVCVWGLSVFMFLCTCQKPPYVYILCSASVCVCVCVLACWQQMCEDSYSLVLWQCAGDTTTKTSFVPLVWLPQKSNSFFFFFFSPPPPLIPATTTPSPHPTPSSAAGCLLARSSVSMATGVNLALVQRAPAVACLCAHVLVCAHTQALLLTHMVSQRSKMIIHIYHSALSEMDFVFCVSVCLSVCLSVSVCEAVTNIFILKRTT